MEELYIDDIKKSDLKNIKEITLNEANKLDFNGFVILPNKHIHDSGYRCFDLILLESHKILGRLETYSDVINLNGIAGRGKYTREHLKYDDWNIDILKNRNN